MVCRAGLQIPFRAARVALLTARLSVPMSRLSRVLMERAFRAAGFAMIGEALAGAMREAMEEALARALDQVRE